MSWIIYYIFVVIFGIWLGILTLPVFLLLRGQNHQVYGGSQQLCNLCCRLVHPNLNGSITWSSLSAQCQRAVVQTYSCFLDVGWMFVQNIEQSQYPRSISNLLFTPLFTCFIKMGFFFLLDGLMKEVQSQKANAIHLAYYSSALLKHYISFDGHLQNLCDGTHLMKFVTHLF